MPIKPKTSKPSFENSSRTKPSVPRHLEGLPGIAWLKKFGHYSGVATPRTN